MPHVMIHEDISDSLKKGYESVKGNNPAAMNFSPRICT